MKFEKLQLPQEMMKIIHAQEEVDPDHNDIPNLQLIWNNDLRNNELKDAKLPDLLVMSDTYLTGFFDIRNQDQQDSHTFDLPELIEEDHVMKNKCILD